MTLEELIDELSDCLESMGKNCQVYLSIDSEGNKFKPLDSHDYPISFGYFDPKQEIFYDADNTDPGEEIPVTAKKCIILWPE